MEGGWKEVQELDSAAQLHGTPHYATVWQQLPGQQGGRALKTMQDVHKRRHLAPGRGWKPGQCSFTGLAIPSALAILSAPSSFLKDWISASSFFSLRFSRLELGP